MANADIILESPSSYPTTDDQVGNETEQACSSRGNGTPKGWLQVGNRFSDRSFRVSSLDGVLGSNVRFKCNDSPSALLTIGIDDIKRPKEFFAVVLNIFLRRRFRIQ